MSGDREKIEIIRKKSERPEGANFDFEFDQKLMAPEAPVFMHEFDNEGSDIDFV